jgi:predicted nucleic acid-binding protein
MELLTGSLYPDQRQKAEAFLHRLDRRGRIVTPTQKEWLRAGRILARYQNRFGHVEPLGHVNDILILLVAERLRAELATENGVHFRIWSRFLEMPRRPPLRVLDRQEHVNF